MSEVLPQEIEVRYILPAVRGKLAQVLVDEKKMSQKDAAKLLGLTEAAISQYVHGKRGNEVTFSESVIEEIRTSADRIAKNRKSKDVLLAELYRISQLTTVKHVMCDIHRKQSKGLESCTICFSEQELVQIKNLGK